MIVYNKKKIIVYLLTRENGTACLAVQAFIDRAWDAETNHTATFRVTREE